MKLHGTLDVDGKALSGAESGSELVGFLGSAAPETLTRSQRSPETGKEEAGLWLGEARVELGQNVVIQLKVIEQTHYKQ